METAGDVEMDVLSAETADFRTYTDVNQDCDAAYIDSAIVLFKKTSATDSSLRTAVAVAINDDAPKGLGATDGSISHRDSYLRLRLDTGSYVLAVSRYPLDVTMAINGVSDTSPRSTPYECDNVESSHGNYQVSFRSTGAIRSRSPDTSTGSRCTNTAANPLYEKCPYHVEKRLLTQQAAVDGTLVRTNSGISVDYVEFTVQQETSVELDMLSMETFDYRTFKDVNNDCDAGYFDPEIVLFKIPRAGKSSLVTGDAILENDDAPSGYGSKDGSISRRDSFLQATLPAGNYMLAIGRYPLTAKSAIDGFSPEKNVSTPHLCNQQFSTHGNYRFTLHADRTLSTVLPTSYFGNKCSSPAGSLPPVPLCPYHKTDLDKSVPKALVEGTIQRSPTSVSVDHVKFTINEYSAVTLDVLSYEANSKGQYKDVNNDCSGNFIDSVLHLFHDPGDNTPLALLTSNDDDESFKSNTNRRSINKRDSYIETVLFPGQYIAVIGRYPLTASEAAAGISTNKITEFSPLSCGKVSKTGNYQLLLSGTSSISATSPNTYIGDLCPVVLINTSVCPNLNPLTE